MSAKENRQHGQLAVSSANRDATHTTSFCRQLHLRRAASRRLPSLDSGRSDPWFYEPAGASGYELAVAHLLELGLLPAPNREALVAMWRRGGRSRQVAEFIAQAWELAA